MIFIFFFYFLFVGADKYEKQCGFDRMIFTDLISNFSTAQAYCKFRGLNLVRIANEEQNKCIGNETDKKNIGVYWIDGTDIQTEGVWLNSDYTNLIYTNWNLGQPNNTDGNENCATVYYASFTWNDVKCNKTFGVICSGKTNNYISHFLDIKNIFNNVFTKIAFHKYSLRDSGAYVKMLDQYNKAGKTNIICNMGEILHVSVEMRSNKREIKIPFNISCGLQEPLNIIRNLTFKTEGDSTLIFWNTTKGGAQDYIIYMMNNEDNFFKYMKSEHTLYSLDNVRQSNWQQICIATIDNKLRTSKYTCSQYSVSPRHVLNLRAYSMKNKIYVSWDKSKDDIHQGYVVNVTSSSGLCQTTIINMEFYTVNVKEQCRYPITLRWIFLKPFIIRNTISGNKYKISVSAIKGNYSSLPTISILKTNIEETVRNLQINTNSSHIFINFDAPRGTKEFIMKYLVKVTLHGRNMCVFKYKVIFEGLISETYKFITTHLLKMCFQYEVEVLPVRQYSDNLETQKIDYYLSKKEGFLYNNTEKSTILKDLNVSLLSLNLLKLSWSNNMPQNDCSYFGFMVELINMAKESDCKTWIITRTTCTTLINDIEKETNCKNKEYLKFQNKWINKTLLLHGQFNVSNTYKVKVWDMTDKIRVVLESEVKYNNKAECLDECYGPKDSEIRPNTVVSVTCKSLKTSVKVKNYTKYNSNICYIDKYSNIFPLCFNKNKSHTVNCDTQQCETSLKDGQCVQNIEIYPSKESVTVNLPLSVSKSNVKGHILLLHSRGHKCQTYVVKTCPNCLDLTKFQEFYTSCRDGSVETVLNDVTTFNGLFNNHEYIFYVIPLLDSAAFGRILNVTIATRLSDSIIPSYTKIEHIENTSLQFTWNSYKKRYDSSYFHHYTCVLVNMVTNRKISANYTEEVAKFIHLESCTRYCLYIYTADIKGQVKLVDHICTYTFSSNQGVVEIEDIESGPSLNRLISWTHSGADGCPKTYRVELYNVYLNKTVNMTTNGTSIYVDDLEKDMTYAVKLRMESFIDLENKINLPQYSKTKEFFTGQVNIKITDPRSHLYLSRKKLDVLWSLEEPASGSVQSFMVRVNNTLDTCLSSITFSFQPFKDIPKQTLASQHLIKKWQSLSKCTQSLKKNFGIYTEDFFGRITSSEVLDNYTLSIYGINVLGIHKLYEKVLAQ